MHCADTWVNIWHNRAPKKSNKYFQPKKWLYQILLLMTVELRLYNQSTIAHLASGQHYKHKLSNKNNYLLQICFRQVPTTSKETTTFV